MNGIFKLAKTNQAPGNKWFIGKMRRPGDPKPVRQAFEKKPAEAFKPEPVPIQAKPAPKPVKQSAPAPSAGDIAKLRAVADGIDPEISAFVNLVEMGFLPSEALALKGKHFDFSSKPNIVKTGTKTVKMDEKAAFKIWQFFKEANVLPDRRIFRYENELLDKMKRLCRKADMPFNEEFFSPGADDNE